MSELVLTVNNKNYVGFKEVALLRSIQQAYHQFELKVAPDLGNNVAGIFEIEDGAACTIHIDDDLVTTGYVDDINVNYDAQTHEIVVTGRSKVADLADCSTAGQQAKAGQTLLSIMQRLCKDFAIDVLVDSSATEAANQAFTTTDVTLDAGQPIWDFIEELARIRAVLLVSNAAGNLVITRSGSARADNQLKLGVNIKSAQGMRSHRSLFSEYSVSGQQPILLTSDTSATSQPAAKVVGDSQRYRPMFIHADSPADNATCKARAEWQRRVNYGRSRSITYTVKGWHQNDNGRVWMPNELINITDARNGLDNAERLIVDVNTQLTSTGGSTTSLVVMPKAAFDLITQPESTSGATL